MTSIASATYQTTSGAASSAPSAAAAAAAGDANSFSAALAAASGNDSTTGAEDSASEWAASTANNFQPSDPPPIPAGEKWYVRFTGRTVNGAKIYETPLGELGRSPRYGNWFIRYGNTPEDGTSIGASDTTPHMVAFATTNFMPSYRQIWNLMRQAGAEPVWKSGSDELPSALSRSEHAGFSSPQTALTKIREWRTSGKLWDEDFQLPALSLPELPEGTDHPLLRELSKELRRVVADAPQDRQGEMVELLQAQGYGEFLPGGRWFTAPSSSREEDPFAADAELQVANPWDRSVRWQDNPADWRNRVPPSEWSKNMIPGPGSWSGWVVDASKAADWMNKALDTGAFWGSVNLPRCGVALATLPEGGTAALSADQLAGEKTLRAAIARALDEAPELRRDDLQALFVSQGYGRFLESDPTSEVAAVENIAPAAAAAASETRSAAAAPAAAAAAPPPSAAAAPTSAESDDDRDSMERALATMTQAFQPYAGVAQAMQRIENDYPAMVQDDGGGLAGLFAALQAQQTLVDNAIAATNAALQRYAELSTMSDVRPQDGAASQQVNV